MEKTATPVITPTPRWEIIERGSDKGRDLLVDHQGHRYTEKFVKKTRTWRCTSHTICKATVRQVPMRADYQQSDFTLKPHAPGVNHFDRAVFGTEFVAVLVRDCKEEAVKKQTKSACLIVEKGMREFI